MPLGSIYSGIATPTEAAGIGGFGALVLAMVYRKLSWSNLREAMYRAARTSCFILTCLIAAMILGHLLTALKIPQNFSEFVVSLPVSRWVIMILLQLLLLVLGCFLEPTSIIVLVMPVLMVTLQTLDFNLVWFAAVSMVNYQMANITPPVGFTLYVVRGIAPEIPLADIIRGSVPFFICQAICLALVMAFEPLSLWLPSMMFKVVG